MYIIWMVYSMPCRPVAASTMHSMSASCPNKISLMNGQKEHLYYICNNYHIFRNIDDF